MGGASISSRGGVGGAFLASISSQGGVGGAFVASISSRGEWVELF